MRFVERHFTCNPYLASSRVRDHGDRDSVQPGRERGIAAKLRKSGERANECVLRELPGFLRVSAQSIGEGVDPWRVRVVQRPPGQPISRNYPGDELSVVHAV